jgi:hypothetical protein
MCVVLLWLRLTSPITTLIGEDLGVAHRQLPSPVYPAFSLFHQGDQITIIKAGAW